MLKKIKLSMRISHHKLDKDIQNNISACLLDLERAGINADKKDSLIVKAVELYCKWQYDYGGKGEKYEEAYTSLQIALCLSGEYKNV